jgi:hypothetical protein
MSRAKYQITPLGFFGKKTADALELYFHRMGYNAIVMVAPSELSWEKVEYHPRKGAEKTKKQHKRHK